jgi:hypothetical protein
MKHLNMLCRQNSDFCKVKSGGTYICPCAFKIQITTTKSEGEITEGIPISHVG